MKQFFLTLKKYNLIAKGDKILVALSGGPDSLCLAHLLCQIAPEYSLELHFAHINHMFRAEARDEMAFVMEMAEKWGIPVTAREIDVPAYIKKTGLSPQDAARKVRYSFLEELAGELHFNKIALGHNANDQAETVLMNLMRGSGVKGLSGISPMREGKFIRPLIDTQREDIEHYCRENDLNPREDPSNKKSLYLRNRVRHELIPYLEKYNPNIKEILCHTAALLSAEDAYLEQKAKDVFDLICEIKKDAWVSFPLESFAQEDLVLKRRLVRLAWQELLGSTHSLPFGHVERILSLPQRLQLPAGLWAWQEGLWLKIGYYLNDSLPQPYYYQLPVPGKVEIKEIGAIVRAEIIEAPDGLDLENKNTIFADIALIHQQVIIRSRKPGDRFGPLGMEGTKKLKDFFIDAKVPRLWRDKVPLICALKNNGDDEIVWVAGYRLDRKWKVGNDSLEMVNISLEYTKTF